MLLKIRVWDPVNEKMWYPEMFEIDSTNVSFPTDEGHLTFPITNVMMFTGLKDFVGVEDYVGNIWRVTYENRYVYYVREVDEDNWQGYIFDFACLNEKHVLPVHSCVTEQGVIVGNIYEAPQEILNMYKESIDKESGVKYEIKT